MRKRIKSILTAILLLALATCLILVKMNILSLPAVFAEVSTIGLIIAILMVVIIFHSILDFFYPGIFFPLAVLCIIFDDVLGITALTPWIVLIVALLLTIAMEKLFPSHWIKKHFRTDIKDESHHSGHNRNIDIDIETEKNREESYDDKEYIYYSVKMGSGTKYVDSKNLKTADISCDFGELAAYFDKAQAPGGIVNIKAKVAFGELRIFVPRDWDVENKVTVSFGECEDSASNIPGEPGACKCIIEGSVSFGDMQIIKI